MPCLHQLWHLQIITCTEVAGRRKTQKISDSSNPLRCPFLEEEKRFVLSKSSFGLVWTMVLPNWCYVALLACSLCTKSPWLQGPRRFHLVLSNCCLRLGSSIWTALCRPSSLDGSSCLGQINRTHKSRGAGAEISTKDAWGILPDMSWKSVCRGSLEASVLVNLQQDRINHFCHTWQIWAFKK